jgi:hypothetical protein
MTYLCKISLIWYARIKVPLDLQQYFPSKVIKRSLHTASKTVNRRAILTHL